jgi:hypothetical protein
MSLSVSECFLQLTKFKFERHTVCSLMRFESFELGVVLCVSVDQCVLNIFIASLPVCCCFFLVLDQLICMKLATSFLCTSTLQRLVVMSIGDVGRLCLRCTFQLSLLWHGLIVSWVVGV